MSAVISIRKAMAVEASLIIKTQIAVMQRRARKAALEEAEMRNQTGILTLYFSHDLREYFLVLLHYTRSYCHTTRSSQMLQP
jgi:hypothetical protein